MHLASGIISFHDFTSKDCRNSQNLIGAVAEQTTHEKNIKFDSEIDKMHIKFAQEMETGSHDIRVKNLNLILIYAEEYNKLRLALTNIYETLDAKANYNAPTN